MNDLADSRLVVGLATPEFGVRMGPGRERGADTGRCAQPRRARRAPDPRRCRRGGGCTRGPSSTPPTKRGWSPRRRATAWWRSDPAIGDGAAGADGDAARRRAAGRLADRETRAADSAGAAQSRAPAGRIAKDGGDRQARRRRRARLQQHAHGDPRLLEHDPGGRAAEVGDPRSGAADSPRRRERRRADAEAAGLQPQAGAAVRSGRLPIDARQPAAARAQRRRRGHHRQHADGRGPVADPRRPGAGRAVDPQPRDQRARRDARTAARCRSPRATRRARTASAVPTPT